MSGFTRHLCLLLSLGFASHALGGEPVAVAHRGLFKHAPENTLAAFNPCLELRFGFELDVRRSRDGQLVCLHDSTLDRTTNAMGNVADKTLSQLKGLDAGGWFHPQFTGETIPTVAEVLKQAANHRAGPKLIALDIKIDDNELAGDLAEAVASAELLDRVVCIGLTITDADLRKRFREANPKLPLAVLAQTANDLEAAIADGQSDWVYVRFLPNAEQAASVHRAGKKLFAAGPLYAGVEKANWQQAAKVGIDAVLTDYPLEFRQAVGTTERTP